MALFIGSFVVFALVITALGANLLIRGQSLKLGCGSLIENPDCEHRGTCGGVCQRDNT